VNPTENPAASHSKSMGSQPHSNEPWTLQREPTRPHSKIMGSRCPTATRSPCTGPPRTDRTTRPPDRRVLC